eukprot:6184690-Pleurochrysis_carterae.AAC.3
MLRTGRGHSRRCSEILHPSGLPPKIALEEAGRPASGCAQCERKASRWMGLEVRQEDVRSSHSPMRFTLH